MNHSIIIGADIVPTPQNESLFKNCDIVGLIGKELLEILNSSDICIFNLETPLTNNTNQKLRKYGPSFRADIACAQAIKEMGIDILTIANNHIMDYGLVGLLDTINALEKSGLQWVGVGKDLANVVKGKIIQCGTTLFGIYVCVEKEFSCAEKNRPGANAFYLEQTIEDIARLKTRVDNLIVLYHGGTERYRYPSPKLQTRCRCLVDYGADLIICQHSHCIGCEEVYKGKRIVYGQGNFLMAKGDDSCFDTGLLLRISEDLMCEYIPVIRHDDGIMLAPRERAEYILEAYKERSKRILIEGFVEKEYETFIREKAFYYLLSIDRERGFLTKVIDKISRYRYSKFRLKRYYTEKRLLALYDFFNCDTHIEAFSKVIERVLDM